MAVKLLVFHDSPDFGGHERMLLALLPAVTDDPARFCETVFAVPTRNTRLRAALEAQPRLRVIDWPFEKRRAEPYLHSMRSGYRAAVRDLVGAEAPDTVLLVQGRIENCAVPMMAVPRGPRLVSYVPMAHTMVEMGRGAFGDFARRQLYARPDAFVVPVAAVEGQLRRAGASAPVAVAHNVVDAPPRTDPSAARRALDLPADGRIALFLGRLDAAQKGIDLLLGAIARAGRALAGWTFVFVGDGPARNMIAHAATGGPNVRVIAWTDRPDLYLSAADVLLLPSRWEGLPLVLLEAMTYGVPVLCSEIDVFAAYVAQANRIDFVHDDLAAALQRVTAPAAVDTYAREAVRLLAPHTLDAARRAFANALAGERA